MIESPVLDQRSSPADQSVISPSLSVAICTVIGLQQTGQSSMYSASPPEPSANVSKRSPHQGQVIRISGIAHLRLGELSRSFVEAFMNTKICWIAALFASVGAHALNLNPDGEGQVLIFPYYTVNGGNSTLISLQNRTSYGKALRVRFHEAQNGRDVLEFNLYLAPRDVWTAAVYSLWDGGPAVLSTDDESCTVPAIKHNALLPQSENGHRYVAFRNYQYTALNDDAGSNALTRTRSGHLEVIEMGIVGNGEGEGARHTLDAISGGRDGRPRRCAQLINAWSPFAGPDAGYWLQAPIGAADLRAPTPQNGGGQLVGSVGIVNFVAGTQMTYLADAIEGFSATMLHTQPGLGGAPQLSDANWPTADVATAYWFDDGVLQSARYPRESAIDAVSALFTLDVLHNEFARGTAITSEWVLTFPTKRFYVDPARTVTAIPPFTNLFQDIPGSVAGSAVGFVRDNHDREERSTQTCFTSDQCNPGIPLPDYFFREPSFAAESAVMSLRHLPATVPASVSASAILAAPDHTELYLEEVFGAGWVALHFWVQHSPYNNGISDRTISRPDLDGRRLVGLPVTGFWVEQTHTNSLLANFAGLWRHRGTRCSVPSGSTPAAACPAREYY